MQNDKQWIEDVLNHKQVQKVPYNFMFSPPAQRRAEEHYGKDLEESLSMPLRMTGTDSIKPLYAFPSEFGDTIKDEFGVVWSTSEIDRGSPVGPCIEEATLTNYNFPEPSEEYRFKNIGNWCDEQQGRYRIIWVGDLWERATFMRGMEDLLMDVALNKGFVEELLEGITGYILQTMQILFERGEFEGIAISDDYGTQKGMIISPDHWRELVKPCLAKIYSLAKENNRTIFHHSCGNILPIIGDMIDIGLDILHPIQPEAMDIFNLKKEFGNHLTFCGGIRTQDLLVRGTPEKIKEEVKKLKREMGKGGGYILEPGITIQDDVLIENMVAMIDEARNAD